MNAAWTRVDGSIPKMNHRRELVPGTGTGWYETTCDIPDNSIYGVYHLSMLNLSDEWSNMQDYLPTHVTQYVTAKIGKKTHGTPLDIHVE